MKEQKLKIETYPFQEIIRKTGHFFISLKSIEQIKNKSAASFERFENYLENENLKMKPSCFGFKIYK